MSWPGPLALGRGVVVEGSAELPEPWHGVAEVVVHEGVVAAPEGAVTQLHEAWLRRTPIVVRLAVDPVSFRVPVSWQDEPWMLDPSFEPWLDRLHHLVWSNNYDARGEAPVWWWSAKAIRLGATAGGPADVVLADGTPAWIDGGPRGPLDAGGVDGFAVVHRDSVESSSIRVQPPPVQPMAELAPDQMSAVAHGAGPARIIAPAGSGKTRVLTERARHLLRDRAYEPEGLLAVAFNVRAKQEMEQRTADLAGLRVQTLNGLGWWVLRQARSNLRVLDEREVRGLVDQLVPGLRRKTNTDPVAPYLDGLSRIRLGLADPKEVELEIDDVDGLAEEVWPRWRAALARAGGVDFDEQVYGAVEALLRDGELRRRAQERCRHLLVDEFQDLTPCHVLLLRLLSAPGYDVFGVGDDDQVIYGYMRASPRFLVDFDRYFPGAASHPLGVNHRCPAPVVTAASSLLRHNRVRVPKEITAGAGASAEHESFIVARHESEAAAHDLLHVVQGWLQEPGVSPGDLAVLARVNSLLLAPHVALNEAGIPVSSELGEEVLRRTGIQAALSYIRLALDPRAMSGADIAAILKRPSRGGLPRWLPDRLQRRTWTLSKLRSLADELDKAREADNLRAVAYDLEMVAARGRRGVRAVLEVVRDEVGLGQAMSMLDASKGAAGGSNVDDLEALIQLSDLHDDLPTFEGWLRSHLTRERGVDGVTLASVHRVKGQEWDRVVVFGITDGVSPHRLADDIEEERRIVHVGITRGRLRVVVLGDRLRASPFLDELEGREPAVAPGRRPAALVASSPPRPARPDPVRTGDPAVTAALKAWRSERSKSEGKPAYIYLTDGLIDAIATKRPDTLFSLRALPGMGPKKLEDYGEELLDVLRSVASPSE